MRTPQQGASSGSPEPVRARTRIGVFGTRDEIEVVDELARGWPADPALPAPDLVPAVHRSRQEARRQFERLADRIDVALFSGPLHQDLANQEWNARIPVTSVPISGSALTAVLLRGLLGSDLDPARVSIDSLLLSDVHEVYDEIGLSAHEVSVSPYVGPAAADTFLDFHRACRRRGATAAITTRKSVRAALAAEGTVARLLVPTKATVRAALKLAATLGVGFRVDEQQLVTVAVQLIEVASPDLTPQGLSWVEEQQVLVHQQLLESSRVAGATFSRVDRSLLLLTMTTSGLNAVTGNQRWCPFAGEILQELNIPVAVGIGMGGSARDSMARALTGARRAAAAGEAAGYQVTASGEFRELPVIVDAAAPAETAFAGVDERAHDQFRRLLAMLDNGPENQASVGAEEVASALDVTVRSGRRILRQLTEAGLAVSIPSTTNPAGGRTPQRFRLFTERLREPSATKR